MSWWLCPSFKYRLLYREPVICLSLSHQFQTKVKSVPPFKKKNKTMFLLADWKSTDGVSSTLLLTSVTCGSDLNWDVCYNQSLKFYFECLDDAQVFFFFFHLKILKKKWPNKSAGILQKGFLIIVSVGSYTSPFGSRSWTHPPKTHHDGITQYSISHRDCNWKEESSWYTLSCLDKFPSCLAKQNNPLRDDTV